MSNAQREKGKRGEREWRDVLREHGFDARRGQQYSGTGDSPDVICEALPVHFEVKRTERPNLPAAYEQAHGDAHIGREPIVVTRRNAGSWKVYCDAGHYLGMWKKIFRLEEELQKANPAGT
jgi:Holliday junction resolvase